MYGQISIALSIPLLGIRESGMAYGYAVDDFFFSIRERAQRLGQQFYGGYSDRDFARLGAKQLAAYADNIGQVQQP
jgi:hypothetical protein